MEHGHRRPGQPWPVSPRDAAVQHALDVVTPATELPALRNDTQRLSIHRSPLAMGVLTARFDSPGSMAKDDIRAAPPGWLKDFKNGRPDATMAEKVSAIRALPRSGGRTLAQGALAQGGAGVDLGTNPADLANSRDQDCCPSFREGFGAGLRAIATGRCDRNPSVAVTFGFRLQLKQLAEIQTAACKLGISPIMHRKGKAHGPAALVRSTRNLSLRRWSRRVISAEAWPSCFWT